MYLAALLVVVLLASTTLAYPIEVVQNEDGDEFALISLQRVKRGEAHAEYDSLTGQLDTGLKMTPVDTPIHRVDTRIFADTNLKHNSPITKGAEARYTHKPSGSTFRLNAANTPGYGTDVGATATYNLYRDKHTTAGLEAHYNRRYGGRYGAGRPDYGAMFTLENKF